MGDALHVLHALVTETGDRWGAIAADFQRADAQAILEPGPDDPRLHWLGRPRGGSKTSDVAGMAIAALLEQCAPGDQSYVVASDADQAQLLVDAAGGFVRRTPELGGLLTVERRRIVTPTGAAVNVLPADGASAFGLRGPLFCCDEIAQWASTSEPRRVWEAVFSAVPKRADTRLVIISTAGDPAHWCHKILDVALSSAAWRVNEVHAVPWVSAEALEIQRALLLPSQFARLHESRWVAPEDRLTTVDDVTACVSHSGPLDPIPGVRYVVGVDLGVKRDASVVAVAHAEDDGTDLRVVVDRVEAFVPRRDAPVDLGVVEAAIRTASRTYNRAEVVADPWQALRICQNLRASGVPVTEYTFSAQSISRIALTMFGLLRDRRIGLPDDEALLDELAAVRLIERSPGVFRMDHTADSHDDRTIAVALAAHRLVEVVPGEEYDVWFDPSTGEFVDEPPGDFRISSY